MNEWFCSFLGPSFGQKRGEEGKNVLLDLSQVDNIIKKAFWFQHSTHIDVKKLKWPTPRHSIFNITLYSFLCFFNAYFNILNFFTLIWKMNKHMQTYLEEIKGSN